MKTVTIRELNGSKAELELPRGYILSDQRDTTEGTAITVHYGGQRGWRIVLRERRKGSVEAEGHHTRKAKCPRTGANTLADAIEWAVQELHRVSVSQGTDIEAPTQEAIDAMGGYPTLIQARNLAYERRVWARVGVSLQNKMKRALDVCLVVFGPEKSLGPWSDSDIDLYYAMRCGTTATCRELSEQELKAYGIDKPGIRFPKHYGRREYGQVEPITAKLELKDLKTLFNKLKTANVKGSRFLPHNPLDGLKLGDAIRGTRADYHRDRFRWLLAAADHADPTGQLRLISVLTFLLGRRINATTRLTMDNVGFTNLEIRNLIGKVRRTHETEPTAVATWADHWIYGAIRWIGADDKEGFDRVVPLSKWIRAELDRYLAKRAAMLDGEESPWLFPHPNDFAKPLRDDTAREHLRAAETIARPAIKAAGLDPDIVMAETPGDAFHPARGFYEVIHAQLLWVGNRNSSYVGGWTCNTGNVQSTVYGELDPRLMLACVEGQDCAEATKELGLIEEAQDAMNPIEPVIHPTEVDQAA